MSGIIGHTAYAMLAAKAAEARRLPIVPVIRRHFPTYLAGAYLGCDIQTVPNAVCLDTGEGVGHGPVVVSRSPITGGPVKPWTLAFEGREVTPQEIQTGFYGRSHLILGWSPADRNHTLGWSRYLEYASDVAGDAMELFGPGHRALAWVLGWMTHVTGDGLIKAVLDGINLHLIDGKYTATNRPVQDLVTFNEIGREELGLNWASLLDDLATTPVEPVQRHYMRCTSRQGRLGAHFETDWDPGLETLLTAVMTENHRYQKVRNARLIRELSLTKGPDGRQVCDAALSAASGGLTYPEMVAAAEAAQFRHALWQMGELIADVFEKMVSQQASLQELPTGEGPTWDELTRRWGSRK